jgi:beta-barrel assembly-enhancing protease
LSYLGRFSDGETAESREVLASFHDEGLCIYLERNELPLLWSYAGITLLDDPGARAFVRMRHKEAGEALFTIEDVLFVDELFKRIPRLATPQARARRLLSGVLAALICLGGFAGLIWVGLPLLAAFAADQVPLAWERRIKDAVYEPVLRDLGATENVTVPRRCADPDGIEALDRLTRKLSAVAGPAYVFQVVVLDLKMNNAFALPGGHIVFTRGFLEFAESGNEFAGVLAHEMSHVLLHHGLRRLIEGFGLRLALGFAFGGGLTSDLAGSITTFLLTASYSREAELQADASAIALLNEAKLASDGFTRYLDRLTRTEGDKAKALHIVATHPSNEERIRAARLIQAPGAPAMTESDWRALKGICAYRPAPTAPPTASRRQRT